MTMKTDNAVKLGIDDALKGSRFRRKGNSWYRETEEAVLLVDVQKSNFGEQYYVNLGVLLRHLLDGGAHRLPPKENQCHIRVRIEALKPDEEAALKGLLDIEDGGLETEERRQAVSSVITRVALPFLNQCGSLAGILDADARGQLAAALVDKRVRDRVVRPTS